MERALKRLLRVYPIARNWMALSNYMAPLQSIQNASYMYSTNPSDYTQLENVTKSFTKTNTYRNVTVVQEPIKILEMAATDTNISLQDAVNTLSTLFKISKQMNNRYDIENHLGFIRLCKILHRDVRLMQLSDVIESLKVLTYFKIQNDSFLIQSLLQIIRTKINEMSIHDIIFTSFLLNQMESTPLRDALLIALPLVFEIQLPTKLDTDDMNILVWSLRFVSFYNIQNPDIHNIILQSLWKHEHAWNVQTAKSIFSSLCTMSELSPTGCELLSQIQNVLVSMAKQLSVQDIIKIFHKLRITITKKHKSVFYNETFVDTLVNSALSSNIDYKRGIFVLQLLNYLNHIHIPFLEYLAAKCFENPSLLKNAPYNEISVFLEGFVNADYKPVFWDTIKEAIINTKTDNRSSNRSFIRFVLHLIALDCYNPNLLSQVFSTNIRTNEPLKNIYAREMLLLYQSIKTLYPMYDGPWPQQNLLEYANTIKLMPSVHSLKSGLERALGGPQYVHNDLRTKLGHYIDHVVVMRKGGYPIAINTDSPNSKVTYVEDLQTPSESQMIFIFNLPDNAYAVNSQRLKSTWALKMKSAEALTKSNTIGINSNSWMKLPEYERVPYLMQAIKLKCEDLLVSTN